ncbi:S1C family serine protease [Microbacterium gallinarum]|uniref:Trypsin-like peptidase domain-containing protein n=1 Tax=Microbacterium gallinarum TaxID=2762209 RepID=A0ABR8X534_9MICO|nr:trypsin-like peptidase domain-containing protein [Microbacterium gallinarum]MBD8024313.1 trypsin-like peptidase domain-containing protein [Microbacterium gallinarum]
MSDTQGNAPADQTPADAAGEPSPAAPSAETTPTTPAPAAPSQPPAVPAPPTTAAWRAAQQAPPAPQAQQAPTAPPTVYPVHQQAYARPQGYAGQPAAYPQGYAGQQPQGAAFGQTATGTQPTVPLGKPASTGPKKPTGAGRIVGLIAAAAIVGGAAGLGGAYAGVNLFAPDGTVPAAGPATVTVNDSDAVNQTTAIAAKVVPSVVTIQATSSGGGGTGSGVVLTEDGYVVTNTHVVTLDGATGDAAIRVTTSDGRVYDATVVGTDPTYDLAVIKLEDAEDLTPIEFASSSDLNVGDTAIAVGAPLGLANTVTTGIVSALNRSIEIASSAAPDSGDANEGEDGEQAPEQGSPFQFDFGQGQQQRTPGRSISIAVIQTDAAINPGNSGGALVDDEGRLIGINVAIATAGGSSEGSGSIGVGFSIPSDIAQRITDEIIENGEATHGLLGANVLPAASVEGATTTGAYIDEAVEGGAAAEAGLRKGDVVTSFNGVPVTDAVDLTAQVRAAAAGSEATVTYVRDGETKTVDVTLGELQQ